MPVRLQPALTVAAATVLAAALHAASPSSPVPMTRAHVAQGDLEGREQGGVAAYLGVPFAAPPTGDRRWQPPAPAVPWTGVRKAVSFGASCQQTLTPNGIGPWTPEYLTSGEVSEDCLFLNVWTPAHSAGDRLPVMVWIHGGAFTSGSGSVPIYDGAALAADGVLIVTINYRLGVYGFLAHPELTAESSAHASGNYGLLDTIAALAWIRTNIAAFGGDASKVTIAGQSAGAALVHDLIASPLAKGLFQRAIAQSGSGMGLNVPGLAAAEALGVQLMKAVGATSLAGMRQVSAARLDDAARGMPAGPAAAVRLAPIVDGHVLPGEETVGADTNDTPILTGMTADEMLGLNPRAGQQTPDSLRTGIEHAYGASAPDILALYGATDDAGANASFAALARDRGLASTYLWARERLRHTRQPIYLYLWTHPEPGPEAARYKAFHSSEIPYVFRTLDAAPRPFTDEDRQISSLISRYWLNWIKAADPNGDGLPRWPAFTAAKKEILEIGDHTGARPVLPPANLAAFERYVEAGGRVSLF